MKTKVIIQVQGGVVQDITATAPLEVTLIDWDDLPHYYRYDLAVDNGVFDPTPVTVVSDRKLARIKKTLIAEAKKALKL